MGILGTPLIHDAADHALSHLHDPLFLIHAFEQLTPHAVNGLALLVHDVVVFEEMFAGLEVLGFDGLLGGGDSFGDEVGLDRHILFHAEPQHEILHALAAEDAEQIVLEREEETGTAGVALTAGASAQLVVDAARIVPLGADDVQAAERDHFIVFDCALRFHFGKRAFPVGL